MIFSILFILLITFCFGLPLTFLIVRKHNLFGRIGLSFLLGIGFFTLIMYLTSLIGIRFSLAEIASTLFLLSLPLLYFEKNKIKSFVVEIRKSFVKFKPDFVEKVILALLLFFVVSVFANTLYWPVYIWDSLTLYDFRARLFAQTGTIRSITGDGFGGYYLGYPLLTSLAHTIVYLAGGNNPQFIYSLFYISLVLVFYGQLREFVSRKASLLFTLILVSIPQIFEQSVVSYTNLPYMVYLSLGAIYFYIWNKKKANGFLPLAAMMVGFSTWTRSSEPFWMVILGVVVIMALVKKRYTDILVFPLFFFPIQLAWKITSKSLLVAQAVGGGTVGYFTFLNKILDFPRWVVVTDFLYKYVITRWGIVFTVFVACFANAVITRRIKESFLIYFINFVLLLALFVGTFVFSFTFPEWQEIPDSASRMAMIFYPLFIFAIGLTLGATPKVLNK